MKKTAALFIALTSFSALALDCNVEKNGEAKGKIMNGAAVIDTYQHEVIEVQGYVVMNIFDRKTPNSSAKIVAPAPTGGKAVSVALETSEGTYKITCK